MSLEYVTLSRCTVHLENAIRSDMKNLTSYLRDEGFIKEDLGDKAPDPGSNSFNTEKVAHLVMQIMAKVKSEGSYYYKFINHFRLKHSDIVEILDAEYFGLPARAEIGN